MMKEDDEKRKILQIVAKLAGQINTLAKCQAVIVKQLQQVQRQHQVLHFPSPSIIESSIVESPFIFPSPPASEYGALIPIDTPSILSPVQPMHPRILVVEDDPICQSFLRKTLSSMSSDTLICTDGLSAVAALRATHSHPFSLILMDINLPVMDGMQATREMRLVDGRVPIVSMTSATRPDDVQRYFAVGMNDVLSKPFSREALCDLVSRYCLKY